MAGIHLLRSVVQCEIPDGFHHAFSINTPVAPGRELEAFPTDSGGIFAIDPSGMVAGTPAGGFVVNLLQAGRAVSALEHERPDPLLLDR